jgi:UDP-glucose 4-epimerase
MNYFGKKVLVTGGTGSFGKAVVNSLLLQDCQEIRVLSRDEAKQEDMRIAFNRSELKFYIGDIRDKVSVGSAMKDVDFVFHAAALKQVPSCEFFPLEAVKTNVIGSQHVIEAAVEAKVKSLVCLSTDKAVMPINAMGISKAMMEKVIQSASRQLNQGETILSCVRYGNVMCSRGSVIPLFIRQIRSGQPITITEASMTRFMLTLEDAVSLVNFAFQNAKQGDIFIKKAPACTLQVLVDSLMELFEANNPVKIIGIRHGEKLYETLVTAEELRRSSDMGDYYCISIDDRDLNYSKYFTEGDVKEADIDDYHSHNTYQLSKDELKDMLLRLPEIKDALQDHKSK